MASPDPSNSGARPQTSPVTGSAAGSSRASSTGLGAAASSFNCLLGEIAPLSPQTKDDVQSLASLDEQHTRNFTAATVSTHASLGGLLGATGLSAHHHEQEINIADLETRIRRYNLQLIQPTIHKTTLLENQIKDLRAEIQHNSAMITDWKELAVKVEDQVVVIEGFREEMSKWENERREVQAHVAGELSSMTQDLDNYRYSLERKDASIHSVQRTMDRLVGELSKIQEGAEALRQHVDVRLANQGKVLNESKTELECKLISLETKHNKLSDELWGEETGLARCTSNLTKTNSLVMSLSEEMKRMQHDKANVAQLESVQDDVGELIRDANCNVTMLKQTVDTMVNDVKAHFKTATNTVAAHNATMLSEVRASYQEELSHTASLRSDVMQFMKETQKNVARVNGSVDDCQQQTSGLVKKISLEVDELNRTRKRDNSEFHLDHMTMKDQIKNVSGSSETVAKCLEHLSSVLLILLKSESVASALAEQENIDRTKVALMGYQDAKSPTAKTGKRTGSAVKRNPADAAIENDSEGGEAVISVDNRCLSCSGQAQHVLSGFKMACLQYAPGPVSFAKKLYKREELLDLRHKLIEQAQEQLQHGPASNLCDFSAIANRHNSQQDMEESMKRSQGRQASPPTERPGSSQSSDISYAKTRSLPPLAVSPDIKSAR